MVPTRRVVRLLTLHPMLEECSETPIGFLQAVSSQIQKVQATASLQLSTSSRPYLRLDRSRDRLYGQKPCRRVRVGYIHKNRGLVNYARRYRKGLPISSAIAKSAVNQVVSLRMARHRQMRWSDQGAHLLTQVRVHELNGELRPRPVPIPLRPCKPQHDPGWDACLMRMAA